MGLILPSVQKVQPQTQVVHWQRARLYPKQEAAIFGQRAARSLPERWPANPLLVLSVCRFKAIDARMIFRGRYKRTVLALMS